MSPSIDAESVPNQMSFMRVAGHQAASQALQTLFPRTRWRIYPSSSQGARTIAICPHNTTLRWCFRFPSFPPFLPFLFFFSVLSFLQRFSLPFLYYFPSLHYLPSFNASLLFLHYFPSSPFLPSVPFSLPIPFSFPPIYSFDYSVQYLLTRGNCCVESVLPFIFLAI